MYACARIYNKVRIMITNITRGDFKQVTRQQITQYVRRHFDFAPTSDQATAIDTFASFVSDSDDSTLMIMRGSAGTGKTTLSAAIVRAMGEMRMPVVLMAPTGRAAKVFSLNAGQPACTVHRGIYRQKTVEGAFGIAPNKHFRTLFIVDEASMIATGGMGDGVFGTGCLLDDLVQYVSSGRGCRLMLVGDKAQLPPVGELESPALSTSHMSGYGMRVYDCTLDEVLRQSGASGILYNATAIRRMATGDAELMLPKVRFCGFADIVNVPGDELIESLATSYAQVGMDDTMVVTRSNKRANVFNNGIRATVLGREETLTSGDWLMVVKNNYYWTAEEERKAREQKMSLSLPPFIANGDRAVVERVRNMRQLYGFTFADMWLRFPDYDGCELQVTALTDTLAAEAPSLTHEQSRQLFESVLEDYADVPTKAARMKKLREDPYFNAMQVKYAYAVTCHKAQGGQWSHVYVDQGYMTEEMLTPDYYRWLYTAFTRATQKLFLVNWPKEQTQAELTATNN